MATSDCTVVSSGHSTGKYTLKTPEWMEFYDNYANAALEYVRKGDPDFDGVTEEDIKYYISWLKKVCIGTQIQMRHYVIDLPTLYKEHNYKPPTVNFQSAWTENIDELILQASEDAIQDWLGKFTNHRVEDITHLITHSATGFKVPSAAHVLLQNLKLGEDVRAINLGNLGCQGGQSVFYLAKQILASERDAVILTVNADIFACYHDNIFTHVGKHKEKEKWISCPIMSDGAAAFIFENPSYYLEKNGLNESALNKLQPMYKINNISSFVLPRGVWHEDNIAVVTNVANVYASSYVGKDLVVNLGKVFHTKFKGWFEQDCNPYGVKLTDCLVAMHGGGKLVFKALEMAIEKQFSYKVDFEKQFGYSKNRYNSSGNFGCASHQRALSDIMREYPKHQCKDVYILAFGAGVEFHHGYMSLYNSKDLTAANEAPAPVARKQSGGLNKDYVEMFCVALTCLVIIVAILMNK